MIVDDDCKETEVNESNKEALITLISVLLVGS